MERKPPLEAYALRDDQITFVNNETDATSLVHKFIKAGVIGIDCEWRPNELQMYGECPACLLQISADKEKAFVFDLLKIPPSIFEPLFESNSCLKLGFGLLEDANRLALPIVNALDLKDIFEELGGGMLSLGDLVKNILGFVMVKSKDLVTNSF